MTKLKALIGFLAKFLGTAQGKLTVALAVVLGVVGPSAIAGATTTSPLATGVTSLKTGLITDYGLIIPAVIVIVLLSVGLSLLIGWMNKARKAK